MPLVLADVGAVAQLEVQFNDNRAAGGNDLTLRLFTNNVTPGEGDTAATYTEATGGGYAAKTLTMGSWTVGDNGAGVKQAVYAQQDFVFTGALTTNPNVYGYYVTDADGVLQWAEELDDPYTPAQNGDTLSIDPIYQLSKGTPT